MADRDYADVTRRFYDEHAVQYTETTEDMLDLEWLERFAGMLAPGSKVLDIGTAGGRDARWFTARGLVATGIDFSPEMIALAEGRGDDIEYHVMDVRELTFDEATFDGAWCSCVLIHLEKSAIPRALAEIAKVLKPGGLLYILVKGGTAEGFEQDPRYDGAEKYGAYFDREELGMLMGEAGFVEVDSADMDVAPDEYRAKDRVFMLARKAA